MSGPAGKRLSQMLAEFDEEAKTLPFSMSQRSARLIRLWRSCGPAYQIQLEELAYELAPDDCSEKRLNVPTRFEMRANRLLRLWQACTSVRQRLIEGLAFELAPDQPDTPDNRP